MNGATPKFKLVHYEDVPARKFGGEAPGVTIRRLIDEENDGAPVYVLRMIEVAPGSSTPDHSHSYEHENFVLSGSGRVMVEGEWHDVSEGDVVFIPPGARHCYESAADSGLRFLCGIPVSRLIT